MSSQTILDAELSAVRQLHSKVRAAVHRERWRLAKHARARRLGGLVRSVRCALRLFDVREERTVLAWRFDEGESGRPLVELITATQGRTITDLLRPLLVVVHRRGLELTRFDAHVRAGAAVVRRAEPVP